MNTFLRYAAVILMALSVSHALANSDDSLSLEQAIEKLEVAIDLTKNSEAGSGVLEAAAELSFVLERDGLESAAGHLALGNAYFIGEDLGRAVLHYRRGLLIEPGNETLIANLGHARSFVEPTVPGEGAGRLSVRSVLLSWQRVSDRWTLWYVSIGVLGLAAVFGTLRLGSRVRVPRMGTLCAAGVGLVGAGLLGFEQWTMTGDRAVVVVSAGTGMYSGPGEQVYQEVYDGALGVGTEARVLEIRDGWVNIELKNAQNGWVSRDSFVFVAGEVDG